MLCSIAGLGVERIMFAVDWPYESNREGVAFLKSLPLSTTDIAKIAGGNAQSLLRLS